MIPFWNTIKSMIDDSYILVNIDDDINDYKNKIVYQLEDISKINNISSNLNQYKSTINLWVITTIDDNNHNQTVNSLVNNIEQYNADIFENLQSNFLLINANKYKATKITIAFVSNSLEVL